MRTESAPPRFIDEHRIGIAAPRGRVWNAITEYSEDSLSGSRDGLILSLLGTEPRSEFGAPREVAGSVLELSGRHRFSQYRLTFEAFDVGDGTEVAARTFADFPGARGRIYRAPVIGSRGHALAVRGMLRSIRRLSLGV